MTIFLTGSSGYVGQVLAAHFAEQGHEVIGGDLHPLPHQSRLSHFTFRPLDITDAAAVLRAFHETQPDHVIHLAYLMDPSHDHDHEKRVDVDGSLHVLAAANATPSVRKLLLFSSTSVYGAHPKNKLWIDEDTPLAPGKYTYAVHKKTVEEAYRATEKRPDLQLVILRMCTAIGPSYHKKGGAIASLVRAPFHLRLDQHDTPVQWIHEDDVRALLQHIIEDQEIEGTFNLAPDSYLSLSDMAAILKKRTLSFPSWLVRAIFRILWTLRVAPVTPAMVPLLTHGIVASPTKLKQRYSYVFQHSAREAFIKTLHSRRQNGTL